MIARFRERNSGTWLNWRYRTLKTSHQNKQHHSSDDLSKPTAIETFATAFASGVVEGVKTTLPNEQKNGAGSDNAPLANEGVLCKKTLQALRELGSEMGPSFFPQLLEAFMQDAMEHLVILQSAIAEGDTVRLRVEAHALKGASLTMGARGMADICKQLENGGTAQSLEGAPQELVRLEGEFDRVKSQIEQESLRP
jgi:HPt (histidine-containing phosphotransfer) domain-containing protein